MPTPEIFNFDPDRLADYEPERIDQVLEEHPALYINHLIIAEHVWGWQERLEADHGDSEFNRGYAQGLREVVAHLRQGDYVPNGAFMLDRSEERARRGRVRPATSEGQPAERA